MKAIFIGVTMAVVILISALCWASITTWEREPGNEFGVSLPTLQVVHVNPPELTPDPTPEPLRVQTALFKAVGRETWVALSGEDLDRVSQAFLQDPNWEVEIDPIPAEAQVACRVGDDSHLIALAYLGDSSLADLYCQSFELYLETP